MPTSLICLIKVSFQEEIYFTGHGRWGASVRSKKGRSEIANERYARVWLMFALYFWSRKQNKIFEWLFL